MERSYFDLTRRDFMKAVTAIGAAVGVSSTGVMQLEKAFGLESANGGLPVVWLHASSCTGCSVSMLNSIYYTTIDDLLMNTLDLNYHPTVMAPSGELAVAAAEAAYAQGGYVLLVDGAIPTGEGGKFCSLWDGLSALDGVRKYASKASQILAIGSCACFGGMCSGAPNPTRSRGLGTRFAGKRVINIPGCPTHPDWVVGTIAYLLANGAPPPMDVYGRPTEFFSGRIHATCPLRGRAEPTQLGQGGCLIRLGCKGPYTKGDCQTRLWNSPGNDQFGVNFCMNAGGPCIGCTEPSFPDGMAPFYRV